MVLWDIIPTCDDAMSCYTLCGFALFASAGFLFITVYMRYNSNEFRRVEGWTKSEIKRLEIAINGHDDYIDKATSTINKLLRDFAVQENSMQDIKDDIAEIKKDIAETRDDIKTLLTR